jgi:mono/diheme cytochrome c family protein
MNASSRSCLRLLVSIALLGLPLAGANAADIENGKAVFARWCWGCHEALPGHGMDPPAGTYTLQQRYQGKLPAEIEKRTDLSAIYITTLVRSGINVMPKTRKTEITDAELADLAAYLTLPKPPAAAKSGAKP